MQNQPNQSQNEELLLAIKKLTAAIEKSNRWWFWLAKGIVRGLGIVIGVTIVAAVALTILWQILQKTGLADKLREFGVEPPATTRLESIKKSAN